MSGSFFWKRYFFVRIIITMTTRRAIRERRPQVALGSTPMLVTWESQNNIVWLFYSQTSESNETAVIHLLTNNHAFPVMLFSHADI